MESKIPLEPDNAPPKELPKVLYLDPRNNSSVLYRYYGVASETRARALSRTTLFVFNWRNTSLLCHLGVMRICFTTRRIPFLRPWHHRGLSISRSYVSRNPAVKKMSNAELLEIIYHDKENAISTATIQTKSDGLESKGDDIVPQTAPLLATGIPRLPQSPLTDPGLIAARIRHRAVKPLPSGDRSPFQLKLQKNPYGMSPTDLCNNA